MQSHTISYKGYDIHCENYLYWIGKNPGTKYLSFSDCKNEIDRVVKSLEENEQNLSTIIQRKIHQ
jgi:hypothetical protein